MTAARLPSGDEAAALFIWQPPADRFQIRLVVGGPVGIARDQDPVRELNGVAKAGARDFTPGSLSLNDDAVRIEVSGFAVVMAENGLEAERIEDSPLRKHHQETAVL